jgi:hypothetical protein
MSIWEYFLGSFKSNAQDSVGQTTKKGEEGLINVKIKNSPLTHSISFIF